VTGDSPAKSGIISLYRHIVGSRSRRLWRVHERAAFRS
jgi:hypothetical protein